MGLEIVMLLVSLTFTWPSFPSCFFTAPGLLAAATTFPRLFSLRSSSLGAVAITVVWTSSWEGTEVFCKASSTGRGVCVVELSAVVAAETE